MIKDETNIRVSAEAHQELKEAVFQKFQSLRGHLRDKASEALREKAARMQSGEGDDDE